MNILKNVYIKDKPGLDKKINNIKLDGIDTLHVVSDFDKTINKEMTKTGKYKSLISLIRDGNYLDNNYSKKANLLFNTYHPIEVDLNLSFNEKNKKMKEWWSKHIKLLSESKMNKDIVSDIVFNTNIELREKADVFLNILNNYKFPLLLFSSGLGDFITVFLKKENLYFSNIYILSNFFDWDENGFAKSNYKGNKIIHTLNKDEIEIKKEPYFSKINTKLNVIVIGDSITDIKMISEIDYKNSISIGFLNSDIDNKLDIYKNTFDIVITNDGSFDQVLELLKEFL